jgi:retron-type reverse transcriptase
MAGLRARCARPPALLARVGAAGEVPGGTLTAGLHPEGGRAQRPPGIASLEDKVLQRAVCEVLNAVYEADFKGFSYGFRPGRSQHDALDALSVGLAKQVNWVLDADIRGFSTILTGDGW